MGEFCEMCKVHHARFEQTVTTQRFALQRFACPPCPKPPADEWRLVAVIVLPDQPIGESPGQYLSVSFYWQRPLHDPLPG